MIGHQYVEKQDDWHLYMQGWGPKDCVDDLALLKALYVVLDRTFKRASRGKSLAEWQAEQKGKL